MAEVLEGAVDALLDLDLPQRRYDGWIDFLWSVAYDGERWRQKRLRAVLREFVP